MGHPILFFVESHDSNSKCIRILLSRAIIRDNVGLGPRECELFLTQIIGPLLVLCEELRY